MKKILVTGALGQIGTELTLALRKKYGNENVLTLDLKKIPKNSPLNFGPSESGDVTKKNEVEVIVKKHQAETVYHMAGVLSATGERAPELAWNVNVNGLRNILEVSLENHVRQIFYPSSIAVFGPQTRENVKQDVFLRPITIYGITKVAGELLCDYYCTRLGLDVRGVRYPGIISSQVRPSGGTTDYAVDIFYEAINHKRYNCFVRKNTVLPFMYIDDCIKAAITLMEADFAKLRHHSNFNISGVSFSAGELAEEIAKYVPGFVCTYDPDFRQQVADSWPMTIDDSMAREEWGWMPEFDLSAIVKTMLQNMYNSSAK